MCPPHTKTDAPSNDPVPASGPQAHAFGHAPKSNAKPPVLRSNRRQTTQNSPRPSWAHGNHENVNKSKGPDKMSGPLVNQTDRVTLAAKRRPIRHLAVALP